MFSVVLFSPSFFFVIAESIGSTASEEIRVTQPS